MKLIEITNRNYRATRYIEKNKRQKRIDTIQVLATFALLGAIIGVLIHLITVVI